MDTPIDWHDELDDAVGRTPDRPVEDFVQSGRRALRRRRLAAASAGVAAVVAIGGTTWAVAPDGAGGPEDRRGLSVATQSATPSATPSEAAATQGPAWCTVPAIVPEESMDVPATLTSTGLELRPGGGPILEQVDNPLGYTPEQGTSVAIRAMHGGEEKYSLLTLESEGGGLGVTVDATGDFDAWVASQVSRAETFDVSEVGPSLGNLHPDSWIRVKSGVVKSNDPTVAVLDQREADLGGTFGLDSDCTGVVQLRVEDREEFAAYRASGARLEVVPAGSDFADLDAFLAWVRAQNESGQGLR